MSDRHIPLQLDGDRVVGVSGGQAAEPPRSYPDMETALAGSNMFSRTSGLSHQIVIDFPTLEAMQIARDAIIKASVPAVREFARTGADAQSPDDAYRETVRQVAAAREKGFAVAISECQAWRKAVVELRDLAIDQKSEKIEERCFDILMGRTLYPLPSTDGKSP